jgi:decaprenylphospho-beta-D-ribofuranose 2-oxidase
MAGWTLAHRRADGRPHRRASVALLDRLDERVVERGRAPLPGEGQQVGVPNCCPLMYPRLDEWRKVRDAADPDRLLTSDQARRLRLHG